MPWISGAIALGGSLLNSKIAANRGGGGSGGVENDQRETSIEEMFSESFLESLTESERTALETQIQTGSTSSESATVRGSEESRSALNAILSGQASPSGERAIQASIDRVLRSGAPAIADAANRTGSFASSVGGQLQSDLVLRAAQAGATTELGQQNTNIEAILKAAGLSQAGQELNVAEQLTQNTSETALEETQRSEQTQREQQQSVGTEDRFIDVDTKRSKKGEINRRDLPGVGPSSGLRPDPLGPGADRVVDRPPSATGGTSTPGGGGGGRPPIIIDEGERGGPRGPGKGIGDTRPNAVTPQLGEVIGGGGGGGDGGGLGSVNFGGVGAAPPINQVGVDSGVEASNIAAINQAISDSPPGVNPVEDLLLDSLI